MSSQQAELRPGCSVVRMTVRFIDRDSIVEQCTVPSTILSLWMDKVTHAALLACCTATLDQTTLPTRYGPGPRWGDDAEMGEHEEVAWCAVVLTRPIRLVCWGPSQVTAHSMLAWLAFFSALLTGGLLHLL